MSLAQRTGSTKASREVSPRELTTSAAFFKQYNNLLEDLRRTTNTSAKTESQARLAVKRTQSPCEKSASEREALYLEILYTINHKVGTISKDVNSLIDYARDAFEVPLAEHIRLMAKAQSEKPPIVTVYVTIVSARDLEAKDANGFSDPYCMLGIMPGRSALDESHSPSRSPKHAKSIKKPTPGAHRGAAHAEAEDESPLRRDDALQHSRHERDKGSKKLGDGIRKKLHGDTKGRERDRDRDDRRGVDSSPNGSPRGSVSTFKDTHELIPAKYIRSTTVKNKTLNPVWNESFRLDVDEPEADVLHIDLWDHDDETNVLDAVSRLNEVKGMKGLYRYFKQIGQSARSGSNECEVDDFLGSCDIKISTIPSTGFDKWVKLGRSNSTKSQGELRIKLTLGTREDLGVPEETQNTLTFAQHHEMVYLLADYSLHRKKAQEIADWNGELHECAETILHQHALQGGLTDMQKAACRWIAYSRLSRTHSISAHVLQRMLHKMESFNKPDTLKAEEKDKLRDSFEAFIEHSMVNIQQPELAFPLCPLGDEATSARSRARKDGRLKELHEANEEQLRNLGYLLQTLAYIYQMDLYRLCCPFGKEIQSEILNALRKRFTDWLQKLKKRNANLHSGAVQSSATRRTYVDESAATSEQNRNTLDAAPSTVALLPVVSFLEEAVLELAVVLPYNETFQREIAFAYYGTIHKLVIKEVCNRLSNEFHTLILEIGTRIGSAANEQTANSVPRYCSDDTIATYLHLLKLYWMIKEIISHSKHLPAETEVSEQGIEYANQLQSVVMPWFASVLQLWLTDVKQSLLAYVPQLVEVFFRDSSSNISIMQNLIAEICQFCCEVFSHEVPETLNYLWALCELLIEASGKYTSLLQERLRLRGFGDQEGQFDASEHLCVVINSMELVRQAIRSLPDMLQIQRLHSALLTNLASETQATQALNDLIKFTSEAATKLEFDLRCVVYRCSSKMRPEIRKYVCHISWAPERVSPEECCRDLFEYVTANTAVVLKHSIDKNAARFIMAIWNQTLEQFEEQVDKVASDCYGPIQTELSPPAPPSSVNSVAEKKENESFASSAFTFVHSAINAKFGSVFGSSAQNNVTASPEAKLTDPANELTGLEMPPSQIILICTRLLYALRIILANFEKVLESLALENGNLKNDLYKRVALLLRWHQVPTLTVIEQYMSDMLELQHSANDSQYGYLTVRCSYRNDCRCLMIEVISAKGLTPLDSNGLSDPFVCVELYPPHAFPQAVKRQTKVVQKNLSPVFDECFEVSADLSSCRRPGSAILFTVMDYDMLFQNDFGGEAVLALRDVPGVLSDDPKGFSSLKSITLPILHVKQDPGAISVLQRRKDPYAREFAKRRTQIAMKQLKATNS